MTDRWKMNRIGFVNFWLYDEETFSFEDGKLLLRGQNGSGKSITTQSFIPFILDGDRTPSRLDPFGSSDRRMEYYFLGEDGKNESTGYLFLEFFKPETGQYRTIAIGQRARRGKPMDFWGFVINDNRRIGADLQLYREVGSSKIPCTRQEIKKILGEHIPFADNPKDYKKMVNDCIFGFRRPEQYEQFIRLLVKVRAPKLSKEFRPSKVYEILNESLQTLSDDDMRPMVDAMEKMDSIQESLEMLRRASKDVSALRGEYTRYNQYFLAKKAEKYLEAAEQSQKLEEELRRKAELEKVLSAAIFNAEKGESDANNEFRIAEKELESLQELDTDLKNITNRLENARNEEESARKESAEHERRIAEYNGSIFQENRNAVNLESELEMLADQIEGQVEELDDLQEELKWEGHTGLADKRGQYAGEDFQKLTNLLNVYMKRMRGAKEMIRRHEQKQKDYDIQLKALEDARLKEDTARIALKALLEENEKMKEALITELYSKNKRNEQFWIDAEVLAQIEEMILAYSDLVQESKITEVLRSVYDAILSESNRLCSEVRAQLMVAKEQGCRLEEELQDILAKAEPEPDRKKWKEESRQLLRRAGIPAVPVYQAYEFRTDLGDAQQSIIENILMEAGLLDALIVPERCHQKIMEEYPEFADAVISCRDASGRSKSEQSTSGVKFDQLPLYVSEELTAELKAEAQKILECLCGGVLSHSANGEFRHGLLHGRVKADESAVFVGIEARIRQRERRIAEINARIAENQRMQEERKEELFTIEKKQKQLRAEFDDRISFGELNQLLSDIVRKRTELGVLQEQRDRVAQEEECTKRELNQAYQSMLNNCKEFPYERTVFAYDEALEQAESYTFVCNALKDLCGKQVLAQQKKKNVETELQRLEDDLDYACGAKRKADGRRKEYAAQINQYLEYLNQPERIELAGRIQSIQERKEEARKQEKAYHDQLLTKRTELEGLQRQGEKDRAEAAIAMQRMRILKDFFLEELALGLIFKAETMNTNEAARKSVSCLRDSDKNKSDGEMTASLFETFNRHSSNLTNYAVSLVDCFDEAESGSDGIRRRKRITLTWLGKSLYLEAFYKALNTTIEDTELLIQEKDRELFENILSQTISQQLTDRIDESRKWVKAMSTLMKRMDTSMGLRFSLDWKERTSEEEDQLDIRQLESLLLRDKELLTTSDIEKVAKHFRSRVRDEKRKAEEAGQAVNYMDLIRDVLDYRKWFMFQMSYVKGEEGKKILTNGAFNRFSGGEKAMAMYVPLFAAVNAQYQKASKNDHPRMIALDEAFAGVDDKNIDSMFELVERLDFDYIMNSQALWGCYESVRSLKITELIRPRNSSVVSLIHYTWNGHEKILDLQ